MSDRVNYIALAAAIILAAASGIWALTSLTGALLALLAVVALVLVILAARIN